MHFNTASTTNHLTTQHLTIHNVTLETPTHVVNKAASNRVMPTRRLIDNLNATLSIGDCVLLHGANGCGKSHLLKAIAGLIPLSGGHIAWCHQPLPPPHQRHPLIAWLPQELPELPHDRVRDILFDEVSFSTVNAAQDPQHRRLILLMEAFSIHSLLDRSYMSLSGGEKKRVWLCKTLMGQQPIVLLDEPQHHLDVHFQAVLYDLLASQRADRLIIMAEHAQLAHHFEHTTVLHFQPAAIDP